MSSPPSPRAVVSIPYGTSPMVPLYVFYVSAWCVSCPLSYLRDGGDFGFFNHPFQGLALPDLGAHPAFAAGLAYVAGGLGGAGLHLRGDVGHFVLEIVVAGL